MNALRFSIIWFILAVLLASPLLAQHEYSSGPIPAAKGPESDVAVGYTYLFLNFSGKPTVNLRGVDASATMDFSRRWGVTLDSSYLRGPRDPVSGHGSYVLSFLTGPTFVPAQNNNTRLLLRALAGVSNVDGAVQVGQLIYKGWLSRFSWAVGTGIEHNISGPIAIRLNADYLQTKFISTTAVVQPQNDIRLTGSLVLRLAAHRETHLIASRQP